MKRRRLLLTLVPAMVGAGCSSGYGGPTGQTRDPTDTPTETPTPRETPSGYFRTVSLIDRFLPDDDHQVEVTAEVTEDWITSNHTATVDVTLTNRASELRAFYQFDEVDVRRGLFNDEGAILSTLVDAPDCIGTDGKEKGPFGEDGASWSEELAPGESLTMTFGVADDPRTRGCIPPATYRFDWEYFGYRAGGRDSDAEVVSPRLGLKLEIEAPND
jgi:hypothetical protein